MSCARWHVGSWGPLGALETLVKGAAIAVGFVALARAIGDSTGWPSGIRLVQLVLLALATLGLVGAVGERYLQREVIAMAFVIPNVAAHAGMTFAVASDPGPGALLPAFCALMLAGELVKLGWLATSGFTVRNVPPAVVYTLVGLYAVGYAALILLEIAR